MRLHAALKARHFPNCQKIGAELEVSAKTIQRDIDFMRYRLGLPIDYHPQEFGFYYTEPVTGFPSIEVSEGEITARQLDSLLTCPLGTPLKVTRISDQDPAFLRFIESNDLKPGEPVEVESRDDVADSVMLKQRDRRITIGTRAASKLLVELDRG